MSTFGKNVVASEFDNSGFYLRFGGQFAGDSGVAGVAKGVNGVGVYAKGGTGDQAVAIFAEGKSSFDGDVQMRDHLSVFENLYVTGQVTKGSGTFKIDHPLDPANKYLSHSFVESPDMMNIYNGNVITDAKGEAVVELPNYFEALNRDPRYQLTVIGSPSTAYISKKVSGNSFAIKTSEPGVEVSWQVTGIRQDAFARQHPVVVQEEKAVADRGRYLHPEAFGKPALLAIGPGLGQVVAN